MVYYVYIYLRLDGSPYYVGKGCNGRWKGKNHSVEVPSTDRVIFAITNTSEEWAHFMEMELIDLYGRLNDGTGILENWTDGGEGISGYIYTEEHKRKMSEAKKGVSTGPHTEEAKMKIREARKGKTLSDETKQKLSDVLKGRTPWMKGNTHSKDTKQRIGRAQLGNTNNKGRVWITNGIECRFVLSTETIPDGFILGRKLHKG